MIYTVTLNPSLDYAVEIDNFKRNAINRTERERLAPGGKGINVAIVLKNLGVPVTALGFEAGLTGAALMEMLRELGVPNDFVEAEGSTRINVKILGGEETQINGRGAVITGRALENLKEKVSAAENGSYLTLGGAVPPGVPEEIYAELLDRLKGRCVRAAVDAEGAALAAALPLRPFLVKVNREEAEGLLGRKFTSTDDATEGAKEIRRMGAENAAVTLGGKGAVMATASGCFFVRPPKGKVVSAVGSGDSFVAGFLAGYLDRGNLYEAFLLGAAAGTATAYLPGLAGKEEIEAIRAQF